MVGGRGPEGRARVHAARHRFSAARSGSRKRSEIRRALRLPQPLRRGFSFWNQSQRPALVSVRKTGILPRVMQSKTGMAQPRPSAGGAGLFLDPNMALGRAKNPPNVPHQYLDRHRYPSDALRRYSVPDARKRPFSYLQTTLPPRPANAEPHFLLDVRRRGA